MHLIANILPISVLCFLIWTLNRLDQRLELYRDLAPGCEQRAWWHLPYMLIPVGEFMCIGVWIGISIWMLGAPSPESSKSDVCPRDSTPTQQSPLTQPGYSVSPAR